MSDTVQVEPTIWDVRLEKARAYARERARAKRAADPEGEAEKVRAWRKANPEKVKATKRAWYHRNLGKVGGYQKKYRSGGDYKKRRSESLQLWLAKNPDKRRAVKNAWYKANPEKVKLMGRRCTLKRHGLTLEQHDELFAKQGYRCAVCKSTEPGTSKNWHTDHCHSTKRVRGILCNHCNLMLGYAKDNEATLASAIEYLRKSQVGYGAN